MANRHIRIEYDEMNAKENPKYEGIVISETEKGDIKTFFTDDVVTDFADMTNWIAQNPWQGRYMYSSSVDHFVMDVEGYKWGEDQHGRDLILRMTDDEIAKWRRDMADEEMEP